MSKLTPRTNFLVKNTNAKPFVSANNFNQFSENEVNNLSNNVGNNTNNNNNLDNENENENNSQNVLMNQPINKNMVRNFNKMVEQIFKMIFVLKLAHWKIPEYSTHVILDDAIDKLLKHTDELAEIFQQRKNIYLSSANKIELQVYPPENRADLIKFLEITREFFVNVLPRFVSPIEPEILNIRDEIVADISTILYRLRFK